MLKSEEIISDLRNKLQTLNIVIERLAEGKAIPERIIKLGVNDLIEIENLLSQLERRA